MFTVAVSPSVSYISSSEWKPAVNIAAVDCAADENIQICMNYKISGYPTIKVFKWLTCTNVLCIFVNMQFCLGYLKTFVCLKKTKCLLILFLLLFPLRSTKNHMIYCIQTSWGGDASRDGR